MKILICVLIIPTAFMIVYFAVPFLRACLILLKYPPKKFAEKLSETDGFLPLSEISPVLFSNIVLAESSEYFNSLIDITGSIKRAVRKTYWNKKLTGGSTITQQLVRNMYLTFGISFFRKATELFLAVRIERMMTKKELLEIYLNLIYLGNGKYGVNNAVRYYLGKDARQMSLEESMMMVSLLRGPFGNNPVLYPDTFQKAVVRTAEQFLRSNYITSDEKERIICYYSTERIKEITKGKDAVLAENTKLKRNELAVKIRRNAGKQ